MPRRHKKWQKNSAVFFKSVFTADNSKEYLILPSNTYADKDLGGLQITKAGVLKLLLDIDAKKGTGPDEIPNMFKKKIAEWMSKYLVLIFNKFESVFGSRRVESRKRYSYS